MRQVLFNLLANAVRYTTHGGVRVQLSALPGHDKTRARLRFVITDTGAGMPAFATLCGWAGCIG